MASLADVLVRQLLILGPSAGEIILEQHHHRGQVHSGGEFAPDGGFPPEVNGHDHVFQMRRCKAPIPNFPY
jgi:hypothetical protein